MLTVTERFNSDPGFRHAMLMEIRFALDDGDVPMAKILLKGLTETGGDLRHSIVIDQPHHPVAAPCAITYCQYADLKRTPDV